MRKKEKKTVSIEIRRRHHRRQHHAFNWGWRLLYRAMETRGTPFFAGVCAAIYIFETILMYTDDKQMIYVHSIPISTQVPNDR